MKFRAWLCLVSLFAVGDLVAQQGDTVASVPYPAFTFTWSFSYADGDVTLTMSNPGYGGAKMEAFGGITVSSEVETGGTYTLFTPTPNTGGGSWTRVFPATAGDVVTFAFTGRDATTGGAIPFSANGQPYQVSWIVVGVEQSQTVTVSPSSTSVLAGQSVLLTASGGENGYTWNASGGGVIADGSSAVFSAQSAGTYTVTVWSPAGNGFAKSNDAVASITVTVSHTVTVKIPANETAWPVEHSVMQGGVEIALYVRPAGSGGLVFTQIVPEDPATSPVTVASRQVGVIQDEGTGSWTIDPDATGPVVVSDPIPPSTGDPDPEPTEVPPPPGPEDGGPTSGNQSTKNVWSSTVINSDPTQQTDLLTNKTYREGVDNITDRVGAWQDEWKKAREDAQKAADDFFGGGGVGVQALWDGAQAEFADLATKDLDKLEELAPEDVAVTPFTPASGALSLGPDINSGLPGGVFSLQPFTLFPWLETMLLVIREIILWGMAWMFYAAAQAKLERIQFALSLVPQVDVQDGEKVVIQGNQVPGSSTAISLTKRVLVAGVIIGTVHIQLALLIGVWNSRAAEIFGEDWTLADVGNIASKVQTAVGGPIGTALQLMDTVFPITASVAYIVTWFLFSWACMLTYAAASAAAKAIKI